MGTNYYARYNICDCCDRYNELHIGKSSFGWKFLFRGYTKEEDLDIQTFENWKNFLKSEDVKIFDEYDEKVEYQRFIEFIEKKQNDDKHSNKHDIGYLDDEGYEFYNEEFS